MKNYELQAFLQFDDGSSGNAAANQGFNITIARGGSGDATVYQDAAGTVELTRPFTTDQYGRFKFYAPNGYYNILFDDPDVANLNNLLDRDIFAVEAATTEQSGLVKLATQAGMDTGLSGVVPTADVVKAYVDSSGGGGSTNLGYTASATEGTVTSDTGTDATIPAGSATNASLMLPADKVKLDAIGSGAQLVSVQAGTNVTIDNADPQNPIINASGGGGATNLSYTASATNGVVVSDTGTDATIPAGSATNASLMIPADKSKLDGVGAGAQLVSVQAGTNITVDNTDPQNPIINSSGGSGGGGFGTDPYVIDSTGLANADVLTPYIGVRANNNIEVQLRMPIERDNAPVSITVDSLVGAQAITYDGGTSIWSVTGVSLIAAQSTSKVVYISLTLGTQAGGAVGQNTAGWALRLGTSGSPDVRFTINYV